METKCDLREKASQEKIHAAALEAQEGRHMSKTKEREALMSAEREMIE
jgi:hypothetical protein